MADKDTGKTRGIVFLDRDGTINLDSGYVTRVQDVFLLDGAAEAIGQLRRAGYKVVVVTNQSAVGRGMATLEDVERCNSEIERQLCAIDKDACPDMVLIAPDHPDTASDERKPGVGLLRRLPSTWNFDPAAAWVVGDKLSDIKFGANAGVSPERCLLVLTGKGRKESEGLGEVERRNLPLFRDLKAAVEHILSVTE